MKPKKYPEGHLLTKWMCICIAIFAGAGVPISIVTGNPGFIGMDLALGTAVGVAIGQHLEQKAKAEGRIRPLTKQEKKTKQIAVYAGLGLVVLGLIVFLAVFLIAR